MLNNIIKSKHVDLELDSTLDDEEVIYAKDLQNAMYKWAEECSLMSLYLHVNFQFGWLTMPQGFAANALPNDPFCASVCRSDKYRIIASAKVTEVPEDFDFGEAFELRMKNCFPHTSVIPPSIRSTDQWSPGLENRGCSIGLTYIEKEVKETGRLSRDYFITVHTCLPLSYINEIHYEDFKVDLMNQDILQKQKDPNDHLQIDAGIVTYEQHFKNSYNSVALSIAKDNACRLIAIFADLFKLTLENNIIQTNQRYEYDTTEVIDIPLLEKSVALLIAKWPEAAPVYPFTVVTNKQTLLPAAAVKEESPILFGYFLQQLKKSDAARFNTFVQKHKITYIDTVRTCVPEILTDYNTFRLDDFGYFKWFANATPIEGPLLMYQGPVLGYRVYNYNNGVAYSEEWTNEMLSSFPVVFQSKNNTDTAFDTDVLIRNFSLKKGGLLFKSPIEQFSRVFCNLDKMDTQKAIEELNLTATNNCRMIPKKIFYSAGVYQNNRFEQETE
jgi:hypothetical protein